MRLDIRYRMHFRYPAPVWESQNEMRVRPKDDDRQRVISHRLTTSPATRVLSCVDYWGTRVDHVGVREPHTDFHVLAEAAVETSPPTTISDSVPLDGLNDEAFRTARHEFLTSSAHTELDAELARMAVETVSGIDTVDGRVEALVHTVSELISYETGSSKIGIALPDLVRNGSGVCQDFAHLGIGLMRSVGIPARYVSGYLFAADETDLDTDLDDVVSIQTHAWLEAAVPGEGWLGFDPTNQTRVGERHVVIGHGRDYDDVAPVRGVFTGSSTPIVDAEVKMARMSPAARSLITDAPNRTLDQTVVPEYSPSSRSQQEQQQQ